MAEPVPAEFVARVAARLAARRAETVSMPISRPMYDPLYETAAVLSWFDPDKLSSPDDIDAPERLDKLLADSIQTLDPDGVRRWTISPDIRVRVLRQLRESGRVRDVWEATAAFRESRRARDVLQMTDYLQLAFEQYLIETPAPLEKQSLEELGASFQICEWLRQAGFEGLP